MENRVEPLETAGRMVQVVRREIAWEVARVLPRVEGNQSMAKMKHLGLNASSPCLLVDSPLRCLGLFAAEKNRVEVVFLEGGGGANHLHFSLSF